MYLRFKGHEDLEISKTLEAIGLDFSYNSKWKRYGVKINNFEEYKENRELFIKMVNNARLFIVNLISN